MIIGTDEQINHDMITQDWNFVSNNAARVGNAIRTGRTPVRR